MTKGKVIVIRLSDGTTQYATVQYVSGSTVTVQASDGYVYDVTKRGRAYVVTG